MLLRKGSLMAPAPGFCAQPMFSFPGKMEDLVCEASHWSLCPGLLCGCPREKPSVAAPNLPGHLPTGAEPSSHCRAPVVIYMHHPHPQRRRPSAHQGNLASQARSQKEIPQSLRTPLQGLVLSRLWAGGDQESILLSSSQALRREIS